ncbi:Cyclin-dependent kinase 12 [Beauveria bassiana]|nr:Cyclin-dependent kinase 12 [Beauveria bassiana]
MGMRPTTQFQVGKDGYGVYDSDNGYGGDDGGQRERASDIHSAIPPVPPIRRLAPPRVVRQPAAAPAPKQEPVRVKEVVAVRAPVEGNPWAKDRYKKAYTTLDFDGDATVAVGARRVVLIRQFTAPDQRTVQLYLQLRHRNVVEVVEAFNYQGSHYIVMEEMTLCLHHFVRCPTHPSDGQLRSILVQVLDGLMFLHAMHLGYGSLRCRNILVDRRGNVKLANQEKLVPLTAEIESRDAAAVGDVALHLMQKDAGSGVRDSAQWHAFLNFVACAASAKGVAQLRGDQILADMSPDHERSLIALYYTAEVASLKLYKIAEGPDEGLDHCSPS